MITLQETLVLSGSVLVAPPLVVGLINKVKARLQNRCGSPLCQPFFNLLKLFRKAETLSETASWIFRFSAAVNAILAVILAVIVPWLIPHSQFGPCDLFFVIYLLAAMRFFTLLAAMDTSSPFGTFAVSREATLSILVEPASVLSLSALAVLARSTDLNYIFSASLPSHPELWILSGGAFLLAGIVELARMPIDDPTTHLELTMIHEAMILEASGKNLALFEIANTLRISVLLGLSARCFLHAIPGFTALESLHQGAAGLALLLILAAGLGAFESVAVKLNWRKTPEFIAYALTLAFISAFLAVGVKL